MLEYRQTQFDGTIAPARGRDSVDATGGSGPATGSDPCANVTGGGVALLVAVIGALAFPTITVIALVSGTGLLAAIGWGALLAGPATAALIAPAVLLPRGACTSCADTTPARN